MIRNRYNMKRSFALFWAFASSLAAVCAADNVSTQPASTIGKTEQVRAARWVRQELLSDQAPLPFQFTYGGRSSRALLGSWGKRIRSTELDKDRTEHVMAWHDDQTGLDVRCRAIEYHDFPSIEWTVYLRNAGSNETPILEDVRALDIKLIKDSGEFVLHHWAGDNCSAKSYEPFQSRLETNSNRGFAPDGGRPTNGKYPFFNVAYDGGGLIAVLGWPGQWSASFVRDAANGLIITGGQELTHLELRPGEEIRTPLVVLQFWEGDWIRSQNVWRRWMIAHNLPRPGGKLPQPFTSVCLGLNQSEKTETEGIDWFQQHHAKLDYWWMDAGWYPTDEGWTKVGTWEPDPKRFPKGIKAVSDYAHRKGLKLVLWFEPERVVKGTWLFEKHPEWLLGQTAWRLLNLGNPEARHWLTDHIDQFLTREGVDRQDFNFDPLGFWRVEDASDRQGLAENLHVQGYLAFWDELRRRHPDMLIDSCASGGRRNDLETLRRAVPLLRSDFQEPQNPKDTNMIVGNQGHTYGLSFWVPYYGTGQFANDSYGFRSHLCPAMGIGFVPDKPDWEAWHRAKEDWQWAGPNFYGDYYPLTEYTLAEDTWMAWQFGRPEMGQGMVQAFRRPQCPSTEVRLKLRGLDPGKTYEISDRDKPGSNRFSGRELMESGLLVRLAQPRQAALICYKSLAPE
jgi:alpha-galactosidase